MNCVIGVIGVRGIRLDSPLDNDQREVAATVRDSGEALLTTINDILDFSKIEAGRMDVESHPARRGPRREPEARDAAAAEDGLCGGPRGHRCRRDRAAAVRRGTDGRADAGEGRTGRDPRDRRALPDDRPRIDAMTADAMLGDRADRLAADGRRPDEPIRVDALVDALARTTARSDEAQPAAFHDDRRDRMT